MRLSEFRRATVHEFGSVNAVIFSRDVWLTECGGTADDALRAGVDPATVWWALCEAMDVPLARRHGRGLLDPAASDGNTPT